MTGNSLETPDQGLRERIDRALEVIARFGRTDEAHHKAWIIDQVARALTGCPVIHQDAGLGESEEYREFVCKACEGEGPETWDVGIIP